MNAPAIDGSGDLLNAALAYARDGLPVFPCRPDTKRPWTEHGFKEASKDEQVITAWWQRYPDAMIGVPTGEASGCWVLDVDDPELFAANCPVALPETRKCATGKGEHLWFRHDPGAPVRNAQVVMKDGKRAWPFSKMPGAEVRGEGGYVIVPPSRHPTGQLYRWLSTVQPVAAPSGLLAIVQAPDRRRKAKEPFEVASPPLAANTLRAALRGPDTPYGLAALDDECRSIRAACEGSQEATLNAAALKMGALVAGGELAAQTARASLVAAGMAMWSYNDRDRWTPDAIAAKIDRGLSHGGSKPRSAPKLAAHQGVRIDPETGEILDDDADPLPCVYSTIDPGPDLPPSGWPNFYFRIGHEGGMEWQGSTSRKRSSASCVRLRSCWRRVGRWRMPAAGSVLRSKATTAGARSMVA